MGNNHESRTPLDGTSIVDHAAEADNLRYVDGVTAWNHVVNLSKKTLNIVHSMYKNSPNALINGYFMVAPL